MGSQTQYDVVVIGSGPGGYVAAIRAAQLRLKTAIVERERLGGICLNWGCIPTKALLESARLLDEMKKAEAFGLTCSDPKPIWDKVIARSRSAADQMSKGVGYLMKKNNIDVISGTARLLSPQQIEVLEEGNTKKTVLNARNIILATGARPRSLQGLEFDGRHIVSYREAIVLEKQPKSVLIVGAGAIGVEFAYFFSTMGTEVTLVEVMDQILPLEDNEVAQVVERSFAKRGITVFTSSQVSGFKEDQDQGRIYKLKTPKGEREVKAEICLVSVGVQGNIEGLGAEELGLKIERGFFQVDGFRRT
ncbi:MAG: FAD-dependent oxidoreductase, partial [bacterium]